MGSADVLPADRDWSARLVEYLGYGALSSTDRRPQVEAGRRLLDGGATDDLEGTFHEVEGQRRTDLGCPNGLTHRTPPRSRAPRAASAGPRPRATRAPRHASAVDLRPADRPAGAGGCGPPEPARAARRRRRTSARARARGPRRRRS